VPLSHPALDHFARAGEHGWQIMPGSGEMDGFFYACLAKPA
jgi:16S rRNA C967 or C1407 C5-methylase (RsmB/RsmF family)